MRLRIAAGVIVLLAGYLAFNYFIRPIPAVAPSNSVPASVTTAGTPPSLPWPGTGSAAVGATGLGLIASSGSATPEPMWGLAKVMTALVLLEDKPLKVGDTGPSITIADTDVQAYLAARAAQRPALEVQTGEQLSEYRLLQAELILGADNAASTLARWDAGSVDAFVTRLNKRAKELAMTHSKFVDASGASIKTVSTPADLVLLAVQAMKQPVLAAIVAMSKVDLPLAGTILNPNTALGHSGIIGIEATLGGSTGSGLLFAASTNIGNFTITMFGCVLGQASLGAAFSSATALITAMQPVLKVVRVVNRDQAVGSYVLPWSDHTDLIATTNVDLLEWPGMTLKQTIDAPALTVNQPIDPGTLGGVFHIALGEYRIDVPVTNTDGLYPPGRFWRLLRI